SRSSARFDQGRFGGPDRGRGDRGGGIDLPAKAGDGDHSLCHVAGIYFGTIGERSEPAAHSPAGGSPACSPADARAGGSTELFFLSARGRLRHGLPKIFRQNTHYFGQGEDGNQKDRGQHSFGDCDTAKRWTKSGPSRSTRSAGAVSCGFERERRSAGDWFRSFPGVFHAYVEGPCAGCHSPAVRGGASGQGLSNRGEDI